MKENLNEIHAEIAEIQSRDPGGITKTFLQDIPEIADKDWESLKAKLFSDAVRVQEMAISPVSFQVLAAPSDKAGFTFFNTLALIFPVAALVLAFIYSWWFIFLALGFFAMLRTAKAFYRTVIYQGVTSSETVFSFLFSRNTICLQQDDCLIYRKNE